MKDSIKRGQSRAGSGFAERENFRPKVKQLKKTLLTLVALLALTTGAYATEFTSLKVGDVLHVGDVINTSTNYKVLGGDLDANFQPATLVRANIGTDITESETGAYYLLKIKNGSFFGTIMSPFGYDGGYWPVTATSDGISVTAITPGDYTELTFAVHEGPAATPVPLTWDAATPNTATLTNGMPAGNVTVSVDYFAQAELAKSTDPTPVELAPAAIPNVPANTDAPIVTPGTVANIGTSDDKQGTLMYFVIQPTDDTTPTAPDYDTRGWTDKVPTANGRAEGKAYVWYYIHGAEPDNIADRTDDNTRSDSDIKPLGASGFVTLDAEPTYDVSLNQTGMAEGEPALWSAKSTNITTAVNLGEADLEGVKKGETVTVTYSGQRKIIGVKAEKAPDTYLKWDAVQKKLVAAEFPAEVTTVVNADGNVNWSAGTYVVEGNVTINGIITIKGNVDLIIKDGAKLTAKQIKGSNSNYNLSIYGQANQTGQLFVNFSQSNAIKNMATLEVHSCQVTATSSSSSGGGVFSISTFNVYGGSVDAEYTGDTVGYGISLSDNGSMNIYGGDVKAVGKGNNGNYSYGIRPSNSATVTVYGGKLWAECAGKAALHSNITLTKGGDFTGKIEYSSDNITWTETADASAKYVRAGY